MTIEVRRARADEVAAFYGTPHEYCILKVDGEAVALGGLVTAQDGRLWGFLDVKGKPAPGNGMAVVRALRQGLADVGAPVYVQSQVDQFPDADRLLHIVGFRPTEHSINDRRVWVWQS